MPEDGAASWFVGQGRMQAMARSVQRDMMMACG